MLAVGLATLGAATDASAKTVKKAKTTVVKKTKVVKGKKRTLPGKVSAVSGTTITMTKGNKTYVIETLGVTPVNRKGAAITFADIKVGHKISVRGTVAGTTVSNILKLRDVTLPVSTTTEAD
jgi:hypothetical protein